MSEPKRIEYEGPLSIGFFYGDEGPVLETGAYLPPNRHGVSISIFDGVNLGDQLHKLVDGPTDGDWPTSTVLTRVHVVIEVLDATELEPPKSEPEAEDHPVPSIDFDPPPAPETS